jgi:hypothetical protein
MQTHDFFSEGKKQHERVFLTLTSSKGETPKSSRIRNSLFNSTNNRTALHSVQRM